MTKKRQTPEQIVTLLRQVEVAVANGKGTPQACKEAAITDADVLPLAERIRGPEAGPSETAERAREGKLPTETRRGGAVSGETDPAGGGPGKLLSPNRRRQAVTTAQQRHGLSERQACRLFGQWRGTQRYRPTHRDDEGPLTQASVALASQYGRYGYRRITALLRSAGWSVGHDRVERIWRREGLKVPKRQKPRGRLWLNDGSCMRLRPERTNQCVELRLREHAHP